MHDEKTVEFLLGEIARLCQDNTNLRKQNYDLTQLLACASRDMLRLATMGTLDERMDALERFRKPIFQVLKLND